MIVYKTTNLVNNKIYIGKDSRDIPTYLGSGKILNYAIKKYGRQNFKKEILEVCKDLVTLSEREVYWIKFYNSTDKTIGYNITDGGTGGDTFKHLTLQQKRERSEKVSKANKGRKQSEETKQKIRVKNTGKKLSSITISKLKSLTGEKSSGYIKVQKKIVDQIIDSYVNKGLYMKHIGLMFNLNESKIKSILLENNISLRKKTPTNKVVVSEELSSRITSLYIRDRLSIDKISDFLRLGDTIIRRVLQEQKVKFRDNSGPKSKEHKKKLGDSRRGKYSGENSKNYIKLAEEEIKMILSLRRQGLTYQKISEIVKLGYNKVYETVKKYEDKVQLKVRYGWALLYL